MTHKCKNNTKGRNFSLLKKCLSLEVIIAHRQQNALHTKLWTTILDSVYVKGSSLGLSNKRYAKNVVHNVL